MPWHTGASNILKLGETSEADLLPEAVTSEPESSWSRTPWERQVRARKLGQSSKRTSQFEQTNKMQVSDKEILKANVWKY